MFELVEIQGVSVRHDETVEGDGKSGLTERFNPSCLTKNFRSGGNEEMLAVMGVHVVREQAFDWPDELTVETIDENRFEDGSFKENVSFPRRRVRRLLDRGGRNCRLLAFIFDTGWVCWYGKASRLGRGRRIWLRCHRNLGCDVGLGVL